MHDAIWNEFLENFHHLHYHKKIPLSNTNPTVNEEDCTNHFLHLLFQLIDNLVGKLYTIQSYEYPKLVTEVYIGYDERDAADYNTEGYQSLENEKVHIQQLKENHQHVFEIYLLILYQIFYLKNDMIMIQIEENRLDAISSSASSSSHLTTDHTIKKEKKIEEIIISKLLQLTETMSSFSLSHNFQSSETITNLCLKIIILISAQFPLVNDRNTEVC